jgi:4-diphosphocytidyl-2-C-methyl-D-erythritol kinase
MDSLTVSSPCKINFGLNIIEKRSDGFHNIETIFYPISLFDTISIKKAKSTSLTTNIPSLKNDKSNLIIKALNLLQEYSNTELNVDIHLEKRIPIGAGLGGGSSNAASMLLALNKMYNLNLSMNQLIEIASLLGSDVPFFLNPLPSFGEKKGEKITPRKFNISLPILLLNPGIHVDTAWAYKNIKPSKDSSLSAIKDMKNPTLENIVPNIKNDFEPVVFNSYPLIAELKEELKLLNAFFVLMSGSGSTLFALFSDISSAKKAQDCFSPEYFTFIHS